MSHARPEGHRLITVGTGLMLRVKHDPRTRGDQYILFIDSGLFESPFRTRSVVHRPIDGTHADPVSYTRI